MTLRTGGQWRGQRRVDVRATGQLIACAGHGEAADDAAEERETQGRAQNQGRARLRWRQCTRRVSTAGSSAGNGAWCVEEDAYHVGLAGQWKREMISVSRISKIAEMFRGKLNIVIKLQNL